MAIKAAARPTPPPQWTMAGVLPCCFCHLDMFSITLIIFSPLNFMVFSERLVKCHILMGVSLQSSGVWWNTRKCFWTNLIRLRFWWLSLEWVKHSSLRVTSGPSSIANNLILQGPCSVVSCSWEGQYWAHFIFPSSVTQMWSVKIQNKFTNSRKILKTVIGWGGKTNQQELSYRWWS